MVRLKLESDEIEFINASVPDFSFVQMRLHIKELMKVYQPDIVLLYFKFSSLALSTAYTHLLSHSLDDKGLAKKIGPINYFWPIPVGWTKKFYSISEMRFWATDLRTWQQTAMLVFGTRWATAFSPAKRNAEGILQINREYIRDIERIIQKHGAKFHFLKDETCEQNPSNSGPYKSETMALRFPVANIRQFEICKQMASSILTENASAQTRFDPLPGDNKHLFIIGDIHLNPEETEVVADALAASIRQAAALFQRGKKSMNKLTLKPQGI